jgi:uncharacterized coiled-coil protein SlyX
LGHTPEQRSQHALCGAKTRTGGTCRKFAGEGTDHPGIGVCKYHGGSTRSHRTRAVELEAKQRMVKLGEPMDNARPHQVLLGLLRASAGHVAWLHEEVGTLGDLSAHESRVLLRLYDEERDRLTRIAKSCSEAGVEESHIAFQQAQATTLVQAVVTSAREIGLDRDQLAALGSAMRKNLAQISGDAETAEREAQALQPRVERIRSKREQAIENAASRRQPPDLTYPPEEWIPEEPEKENAPSAVKDNRPEPDITPPPQARSQRGKSWLPSEGA